MLCHASAVSCKCGVMRVRCHASAVSCECGVMKVLSHVSAVSCECCVMRVRCHVSAVSCKCGDNDRVLSSVFNKTIKCFVVLAVIRQGV